MAQGGRNDPMQESMRTEELVKALRKPGIWQAPELWTVMKQSADRLDTILKAWEAYEAWAKGFGYPKPLMLQAVGRAITGEEN